MFIGNVSMRNETLWGGNMHILVIVANEFVWEMELIYPFGKVWVYLKLHWVHDLILNGKGKEFT